MMRGVVTAFVICVIVLSFSSFGQQPGTPAEQQPQPAAQRGGRGGQPAGEPRPYAQVITAEAKSKAGVFTVHRIKERLYYEIPTTEMDKEFLWVTQIAKTTLGVGYGGQALGNRVVKWSRLNNKVYLRGISYDIVATAGDPIARAAGQPIRASVAAMTRSQLSARSEPMPRQLPWTLAITGLCMSWITRRIALPSSTSQTSSS